jgi:putative ABC transport system permease protein
MIKHYIKIAIRNLAQQKVLTGINIFGLSVGIACFSLFLLYSVHEFSYDRFHKNAGRIFRVVEWWQGGDRTPGGAGWSYTPLAAAMKKDFPDVEYAVRLRTNGCFSKVDDQVLRTSITFADPDFFKVFSFPLIYGNAATALKDPHQVVVTKDKALQLFGTTNVVGKMVHIKTDSVFEPFVISAVAENVPANSSVKFNMLCNFEHIAHTPMVVASNTNWYMTIGIATYIQLKPGSRLAGQHKRLDLFRKKYYPNEQAEAEKEARENHLPPLIMSFRLQPIRDIHTSATIEGGVDRKNIWILVTIAAGVLLIACINFTTLAIGRSAGRAKEVGVRKVIGGQRKQLIGQFLSESLMISVFSTVTGLMLAYSLLPLFNRLADRELQFSFLQYPDMIWLLAGLTLLVGILAGSYPALVLSGFKTIEVLKSKIKVGGSNLFTRSLVTFQFVISIGLIIATVIILQQVSFMRSKNIGFNKENVVAINAEDINTRKLYSRFKQSVESISGVTAVTGAEVGLGSGEGMMGSGYEDYHGKPAGVIEYPVDKNFLQVMGMQLIAGRTFNPALASDTMGPVIVNEELVHKVFGTTVHEALGKTLKPINPNQMPPKVIIGVMRNFNFQELTTKVMPQMFYQPAVFEPYRFYVRLQPGDPARKLAGIQSIWKKLVADEPFVYAFLDEKFDNFYKEEVRWSAIVGWAGGISIFLACLGLFGLAALAAVNRTKEIGIRKVLGASVTHVAKLLSKDFIKLIIIALLIASPIAWYFMNKWLQSYVWRIDISWWVFALTGGFALLVAVTTISFQAVKAALANPVKSLRTE